LMMGRKSSSTQNLRQSAVCVYLLPIHKKEHRTRGHDTYLWGLAKELRAEFYFHI
jgi:hypothetical protein